MTTPIPDVKAWQDLVICSPLPQELRIKAWVLGPEILWHFRRHRGPASANAVVEVHYAASGGENHNKIKRVNSTCPIFSPPPLAPPSTYHKHPQTSHQPQYHPAHKIPPRPVEEEEKSNRVGIIGATTGGLTAHLLGGGILSTIGGAVAGAAGAKKVSE
ncbi:hypothetical protein CKAH01_12562 [Colletotrichum kahawae]|uniref:Uncharacterized protein n=1 Tax=Colletotrichum kahawae TaxID=34407 RepID=A0AAE0DCP7_COLKA|nr:hypothetical protein CKAH01_12562 [Colletotrichum kahawae]